MHAIIVTRSILSLKVLPSFTQSHASTLKSGAIFHFFHHRLWRSAPLAVRFSLIDQNDMITVCFSSRHEYTPSISFCKKGMSATAKMCLCAFPANENSHSSGVIDCDFTILRGLRIRGP